MGNNKMRRFAAAVLAGGLILGASTNSFALLKPKAALSQNWETLGRHQQYTEFTRDQGGSYTVQPVQLDATLVGDALGSVTAVGVTSKMERLVYPAKIFSIDSIADRCAVAVEYDDSGNFYVATSRSYMPSTLGTLIQDLSLKDNLSIQEMDYTYWKDNVRKQGNHIRERYTLDTSDSLWEMVLSDTTLPRDLTAPNPLVGVLTIPITVDPLGVDGYTIEVTMDGFLRTDVLDTGKGFFIGKKASQAFIQYVTKNAKLEGKSVITDEAFQEETSILGAKSVVK